MFTLLSNFFHLKLRLWNSLVLFAAIICFCHCWTVFQWMNVWLYHILIIHFTNEGHLCSYIFWHYYRKFFNGHSCTRLLLHIRNAHKSIHMPALRPWQISEVIAPHWPCKNGMRDQLLFIFSYTLYFSNFHTSILSKLYLTLIKIFLNKQYSLWISGLLKGMALKCDWTKIE